MLHGPWAQPDSLSSPPTVGSRCIIALAAFTPPTTLYKYTIQNSPPLLSISHGAALSAAWWRLAKQPYLLCAGVQAFLLRKLKLNGSMGLALKLQPILDAAAPRAKL